MPVERLWRHICKVTGAIEFQWGAECLYCGITREDHARAKRKRRSAEEEEAEDDDTDEESA